MIFSETELTGAYVIEPELLEDNRGFFARSYCQDVFKDQGLMTRFVQSSISFSASAGTLRGMHYQVAPHEEAKLVRCTRGAIYDVILDLRPHSPTYTQWASVELTAANRRMMYVPEGFAHGFQTLEEETEVFYQTSNSHHPESARGIRWNDPTFGIVWPEAHPRIMSERDRYCPDSDLELEQLGLPKASSE